MEVYKGIYYGDSNQQKFYEDGAHFKYIELFKILDILEKKTKKGFFSFKKSRPCNYINIINFFRINKLIKQET